MLFPTRQMGRREAGGISDTLSWCQQGLAVMGWWRGDLSDTRAVPASRGHRDQQRPAGTSRNHRDQQEPWGPAGTGRDPVTQLLCGELQEQIKGCAAGAQERKGGKTKQDEVTFPSRSRTAWLLASRTSLDTGDDLQTSHLLGNGLDTRPHINSYCNRAQCQWLHFPTQNINKGHPGLSVAFKRGGVHSSTMHPPSCFYSREMFSCSQLERSSTRAVDGLQILATLE